MKYLNRERVLTELRAAEAEARKRVDDLIAMGGEDPETGQGYDVAEYYAKGLSEAVRIVERLK